MTTFLVLKTLHVLAASLYAGASFVNGFQELRAERSSDAHLRVAALRFAAANNRVFLVPATAVLLATGVAMAWQQGVSLLRSWVTGPLLLFAFLTLLLGVSIVVEDRLARLADGIARGEPAAEPAFRRLARVAAGLGGTASLAILMMFVWMVGRGLPG